MDTLYGSYLSRSKDCLLGISDETLFAEQVSICTLRQFLKWKFPVAAAALNQLAILQATRNAREIPYTQVEGAAMFHIPPPPNTFWGEKQSLEAIKQSWAVFAV